MSFENGYNRTMKVAGLKTAYGLGPVDQQVLSMMPVSSEDAAVLGGKTFGTALGGGAAGGGWAQGWAP